MKPKNTAAERRVSRLKADFPRQRRRLSVAGEDLAHSSRPGISVFHGLATRPLPQGSQKIAQKRPLPHPICSGPAAENLMHPAPTPAVARVRVFRGARIRIDPIALASGFGGHLVPSDPSTSKPSTSKRPCATSNEATKRRSKLEHVLIVFVNVEERTFDPRSRTLRERRVLRVPIRTNEYRHMRPLWWTPRPALVDTFMRFGGHLHAPSTSRAQAARARGPESPRREQARRGPLAPCDVAQPSVSEQRHDARAHSRFPGHALTPTGVMAIRCKQFHLPDL